MHKFINRARGFTLIELLVVIAIIALLASIILVSLNSARSKGKDTRVLSDVNETRTQLETDFVNGVYTDLYGTAGVGSADSTAGTLTTNGAGNANITTLSADANTNGGANLTYLVDTNSTTGSATQANATAYAIYGKTSTGYYCVDSTGNNVTNTANGSIPTAGTGVPATCK